MITLASQIAERKFEVTKAITKTSTDFLKRITEHPQEFDPDIVAAAFCELETRK